MDDGTRNSAPSSESIAPKGYRNSAASQEASGLFKALLQRLGAARQADAARLFAARASYLQVLDWRRGRHAIPLWVWQHLSSAFEARANDDHAAAARARKAPTAPGQGSHNNIAKWNARRFAEKKKPGV
jgi:hypothetical protein